MTSIRRFVFGFIDVETPGFAWPLAFAGVVGIAFSTTAIWFGMRDVLAVGGYCAEGGPYVIATPCPEGSELLLIGGFLGAAISIGLAIPGLLKLGRGAIQLLFLAWPGVFVPLGWNFWEFGLNPPSGSGGMAVGWVVCGLLFWLMGLPVLLLVPAMFKKLEPERRAVVLSTVGLAVTIGIVGGIAFAGTVR